MVKHDWKLLQQDDQTDARGIRVNTKQELEERIYKYFDEVNREPVVYHWKYKMDEISEEEAVSILI